MIGIGILTWRRYKFVQDVILPAIIDHTTITKASTPLDMAIAISCNSKEAVEHLKPSRFEILGTGKNLGVAGGKNRILCWALNHRIDHLFLFEDDTYPIKEGWNEWYIDAHRSTNVDAVTWQPVDFYGGVTSHGPRGRVVRHGEQVRDFEAVGTHVDGMTLLSVTRKGLERVGGMHRAFEGLNGQEHSEWMTRACRAGVTPFTNCTFVGCEEWVDGIDYQEWRWGRGMPSGKQRPDGDPATAKVFGDKVYDKGRETFFRVKKNHRIGELYQDPCWDEATAKEVPGP